MSKKEFDKKLKEEMNGYETHFDVDAMWDAMEGDVDAFNEKEKKKNWKNIFFIAFLFLGITSTWLYLNFDKKEYTESSDENQIIDLGSNEKMIDNKAVKEIDGIENQIINKETIEKKITENEKNKLQFKPINQNFITRKNRKHSNIYKGEDLIHNNVSANIEILNRSGFENLILDEPIGKRNEINIVTNLSGRLFLLNAQRNDIHDFIFEKAFTPSKYNRRYQNDKWFFTLGAQGGVSAASKILQNLSTDSNDYWNIRNETEFSKGVIHFGMQASISHKSGLSISSGIHFTQIKEQFRYQGMKIEVDTLEGIVAYYININGDTIPVTDNVLVNKELTFNKRYNNSYRMFEIPLLLGFLKELNDWSIGIKGGVFLNFQLKTQGLIFDKNEAFVDIGEHQNQIFKSKIGLSYYLGGIVKYHLNDKFALIAQPHIRIFPKSFTNRQNVIGQKYNLLGLSVGGEIRF